MSRIYNRQMNDNMRQYMNHKIVDSSTQRSYNIDNINQMGYLSSRILTHNNHTSKSNDKKKSISPRRLNLINIYDNNTNHKSIERKDKDIRNNRAKNIKDKLNILKGKQTNDTSVNRKSTTSKSPSPTSYKSKRQTSPSPSTYRNNTISSYNNIKQTSNNINRSPTKDNSNRSYRSDNRSSSSKSSASQSRGLSMNRDGSIERKIDNYVKNRKIAGNTAIRLNLNLLFNLDNILWNICTSHQVYYMLYSMI